MCEILEVKHSSHIVISLWGAPRSDALLGRYTEVSSRIYPHLVRSPETFSYRCSCPWMVGTMNGTSTPCKSSSYLYNSHKFSWLLHLIAKCLSCEIASLMIPFSQLLFTSIVASMVPLIWFLEPMSCPAHSFLTLPCSDLLKTVQSEENTYLLPSLYFVTYVWIVSNETISVVTECGF